MNTWKERCHSRDAQGLGHGSMPRGALRATEVAESKGALQKRIPYNQRLIDLVANGNLSGAAANPSGLPNQMKKDMEARSGYSLDDVTVHYNSAQPAKLQALAYTQGNQIYIGPGQERHLGHELGHVIQQKQGIVKATKTENGHRINDDPSLERQADAMSAGAAPAQFFSVSQEAAAGPIQMLRPFRKEFSGTSIGTEQELDGVAMIKNKSLNSEIGEVKKVGRSADAETGETKTVEEDVLLITTDMSVDDTLEKRTALRIAFENPAISGENKIYCIEIITLPIEYSNEGGLADQKGAYSFLITQIQDAARNRRPLTDGAEGGGFKMDIRVRGHHVVFRGGKDFVSGSWNQATVGVSMEAMGDGTGAGLFSKAGWLQLGLAAAIKEEDGYAEIAKARNVYAYMESFLIHFYEQTVKFKLNISDISEVARYEDYQGNLYDPKVKNAFGALPRSSIWGLFDVLGADDKAKVREKVIADFKAGRNGTVCECCIQHLQYKRPFAGHSVTDDATIDGKKALLFEYRTEGNIPEVFDKEKIFWRPQMPPA